MNVDIGHKLYSVDDHIIFGEKTLYYLQRDFTDMLYDLHVER